MLALLCFCVVTEFSVNIFFILPRNVSISVANLRSTVDKIAAETERRAGPSATAVGVNWAKFTGRA